MSQAATSDWFRLQSVPYSEFGKFPYCLDDFVAGKIDGLIIEGVYPADYMRSLAERIEGHDLPFHVFPSNRPFEQVRTYKHLYGITLVAAKPDLAEYFEVAEAFRDDCRQLFSEGPDYESRMREIFLILGRGVPASVPTTTAGQIYMPATIRILPQDSGLDLHCDNNLSHHPTYSHLKTVCGCNNQLSHFLTIEAPETGGELIVYRRRWAPGDDSDTEYVMRKDGSIVEGSEWVSVKPGPGDVIVFTGGRSYHQVNPTQGPRPRLTIGGFIAKSLSGDALYYWS